ncbi:MAG TPA: hypothetical protein VG186_09560 [Solirubrobacteraceae bacterium]|nr:hypothetical protein [Solirubrobacteraceae bacterium]
MQNVDYLDPGARRDAPAAMLAPYQRGCEGLDISGGDVFQARLAERRQQVDADDRSVVLDSRCLAPAVLADVA